MDASQGVPEMVERVAKVLCKTRGGDDPWQVYVYEARAAIEEMLEPTEAMCEKAGNGNLPRGRGDWYVDGPADVWRTMVKAALRPAAGRTLSSAPPAHLATGRTG